MVFFIDEAGSWQVGVDWREALPATHTWSRVIGSLRNPERERTPYRQAVVQWDLHRRATERSEHEV